MISRRKGQPLYIGGTKCLLVLLCGASFISCSRRLNTSSDVAAHVRLQRGPCTLPPLLNAPGNGNDAGVAGWIAANLHFTGGSDRKQRGKALGPKVYLRITAEGRANTVGNSCMSPGKYYVVDSIAYEDVPGQQFEGWPTWTTSGPAYLYVFQDSNVPSGLHYGVFMINSDGTSGVLADGPIAVCSHAPDAKSQAQWGFGPHDPSCWSGAPKLERLDEDGDGAPTLLQDAANSGWFTCDQGCCTATNMWSLI